MADITADKKYSMEKIRNLGIIAHIDAGKTTTSERLLYYTGRTYKIGDIDEGTTVMDWMDQERERGITITSAATTCFWKNCRINFIDTPGHVDFTAEVERSLRVLDGAITVLDAEEMVQSQTEMVWRQADKYKVPRLAYINKMDKLGANFEGTLKAMQERLGANLIVMTYPIGREQDFRGVVDVLRRQSLIWQGDELGAKYNINDEVPVELKDRVEELRKQLIERVCAEDEELLEKFFSGVEPSTEELLKSIRKAVVAYKLVPIYAGSSRRNKGVQPLLDGAVDFLPSPADVKEVKGKNQKTSESETRQMTPEESFTALAFKTQVDAHVGKLTFVRIYSGKLQSGSYAYNSTKNISERVARLLLMHADHREDIQEASAGDIIAIVGLKDTTTGDTLCDSKKPIVLEEIIFPEPVISLAIEPKTKADQEKMGYALQKLAEEDPTFKIKVNHETNQTIISGMGELHLEILVERMRREFGVDANVGAPQVAYKETVKSIARGEGKYIHQSGGRGQYGHCWIRVEPKERGTGFEFKNEIKGGTIPREFIPAIEKGIKEAVEGGILAGFPLVDALAAVYDGSFHEVDSSEAAFKIAGSFAIKAACKQANLVMLEPIMKIEVTVPEEFMGDTIGDLSKKRAQILGTEHRGPVVVIVGQAPLAELSGYTTILRSLTQGRGTVFMGLSHYDEVPKNIQGQLVAKYNPATK